ncbi:MAG: hypothetical protein F6K31_29325 [Symploca sp. SIO2G7]|nr:hypothetical protein [Symploca sp. SIO2G7]
MLESLFSFLLGWLTIGQCNVRDVSFNLSAVNSSAIPVTHVYTVSEYIVALRIEAGGVVRGKQVAYKSELGDTVQTDGWVTRNDKTIGQILPGDPERIWLVDQYVGAELNTRCVDTVRHYQIVTADGTAITPTNVYRKSKITDMAQTGVWNFEWPMAHTLFLELPENLVVGETYQINFTGNELQDLEFVYKPEQTRSESVHVSHLGFDPDDPVKVAFLSTWMGNGGGLSYAKDKPFWVINADTSEKIYRGQISLSQSTDNKDRRVRNHSDTDVFMMDFSLVTTPGRYQVYVEGVGTSYEFEIGEHTWRDAFYVSARGMYHQRSGIALEEPYTDYQRPRPFHPDDGMVIYQSTVPLMDTNGGFDWQNGVNVFEALVKTRTDKIVADAWGGWMDAGDWDRRISHLEVSRSFLELVELYPEYFSAVDLNLPESDNNLPDILDEALWGLDVFRRLQTEAGGIPGGIESAGHPQSFEGSWQESQAVMVYGPGIWSSYIYANVAARAAYVLAKYDQTLAQTYQESAIRAMTWANAELAKQSGKQHSVIYNEQTLAAAELYRLTGDERWHQLFLETTVFTDADALAFHWQSHDRRHAAFVYSRTNQPTINQTVKQNAKNALIRAADIDIENIERYGFKWNMDPSVLIGWGTIGAPKTQTLFQAHILTGDRKYLRAGILATQFSAGANPSNMIHTTGLGYRSPNRPLIVDARVSGQSPPPGISVYGPMDVQDPEGYVDNWRWSLDLFAEEMTPKPWEWPTAEAYFDSYYYIPVTEFTVHQTIGPTAYAWGYLAARDKN